METHDHPPDDTGREPETLVPQLGGTNGATLPPIPNDEWARLEHAYKELQRRDDQAEHRAWRWGRFAMALLGLWVGTLGILVWQFLQAHHIQAFVQVVQ